MKNYEGPRRKVLVVDDNVDAARTLAFLISELGHEVELAFDGWAALATARWMRPDIIFLDLGLPGPDGFSVAKMLRQEHGLAHVRIVAVTGLGNEEDRLRSRDAGIDLHLIKPIDPRFVESLVGNARPGRPKT
jgi:DNA-binding response OmpR family regulator